MVELAYDANGNLIQEITPKGEIKTFAYDNLDQLISKTLPDNQYVYDYDIRGNIESVRNNVSKIDFEYAHFEKGDMISRVHSYGVGDRTDLPNNTISYSYNSSAERVLMETAKGAFSYQRDSAGRLRQVINHKGETFAFKYDLNQRLKEVSSPVSITSFSFDTTGFHTYIEAT